MYLDIIIQKDTHIVVFIISVNVLFLSNSQQVNYDSEFWEYSE